MNIKIENDIITITQMGVHYRTIASWGKLRYNKRMQALQGPVDLETLDNLSRFAQLPPEIEKIRQALRARRNAIDNMRNTENSQPLVPYPVKHPLFDHQVRGANMALLAFGIVEPKEVTS